MFILQVENIMVQYFINQEDTKINTFKYFLI